MVIARQKKKRERFSVKMEMFIQEKNGIYHEVHEDNFITAHLILCTSSLFLYLTIKNSENLASEKYIEPNGRSILVASKLTIGSSNKTYPKWWMLYAVEIKMAQQKGCHYPPSKLILSAVIL